MKFDLPNVAARVFNRPLMIEAGRLDTALSVLGTRILEGLELDDPSVESAVNVRERSARMPARRALPMGGYLTDNGIAVLPVLGTMVRRGTYLDAMCGMTSYSALTEAATEIFYDSQVRGVMAEFDTPGGEAGGVFDLARLFRGLSEETGKPFWAHANELAASAGYALASAADEIWLSETAEVGSIGVVAAHVDVSAADAAMGVKWTYIYAGEAKVDGNPHEPLSERARLTVQDDVDDLMSRFVGLVVSYRGMDDAAVRATEANVYRGHRAVEAGLADQVGTFDEAMEAFGNHVAELQTAGDAGVSNRSTLRSNAMRTAKAGTSTAAIVAATQEAAPAVDPATAPAVEAAPAEPEPIAEPEPAAPAAPDAIAAERARSAGLFEVAKQATRLGVTFDAAAAIGSGMTIEAARKAVLDGAAKEDAAAVTVTAHKPAPSGAGANSIAADRKASAWKKGLTGKR